MRTFRFAVLATAAIVFSGCAQEIQVGALVSESGAAAVYGMKVKKGLDLAVQEINAEGGVNGRKIQLVYRDDGTIPEVGRQVVTQLIDEVGVRIIIGAVSSPVTLAVAPICEEKGVVLLSPTASAPQITDAGEYIFRNYPSDILEGTAVAKFARGDLGLERIAVFAVDNEFGAGLKEVFIEEFKSKYRQVVKVFDFGESEARDFEAMARELEALDPDGVYIVGYVNDVAAIIDAVRGAGIDAVILSASSVTDASLVQLSGTTAENVVFPRSSTFDPDSDDPEVRSFVEAYRQTYDEEPDDFAAHGYDALKIIKKAIETIGTPHPRDVRLGLATIRNYQGASGQISFEDHGDVIQYPRLYIIRQGRAIPYKRFTDEGGSLRIPGRR